MTKINLFLFFKEELRDLFPELMPNMVSKNIFNFHQIFSHHLIHRQSSDFYLASMNFWSIKYCIVITNK